MMPEHIEEWHKTLDDYVKAKRNICSHQTTKDYVIYLPSNEYSFDNAQSSSGTRIPYGTSPGARIDQDGYLVIQRQLICKISEFKLIGVHNQENICAAVTAVWQIHQDATAVRSIIKSFSGLEHRLEFVVDIDGVHYYDDSFGTTPDTAIVAMDSFASPKVMIVGGHEKGNDMSVMCSRLSQPDIRHTVFIGTIGQKLYDLAVSAGMNPQHGSVREDGNSWTMQEIVDEVRAHAVAGDTVLLSTGSSSFGIFKDYKDRGEQFKQVVQSSK